MEHKNSVLAIAVAACLAGIAANGFAQDQTKTQDKTKTQTRDQIRDQDIYGSQLMTAQERNEYRNRMRAAKTQQEREQIRNEHHERMKARAKERGVTLPDTPPPYGKGMGPGPGRYNK
jgi:hypothetical protein